MEESDESSAHAGGKTVWDTVKVWAAAVRPFTFPCTLVPLLIATAGAAPVERWRWDVFGVSIVAVLALHVAANLLNDYFDYAAGVDTEADADQPGQSITKGHLRPRQVLHGVLTALGAAALTAAYLTWRVGPLVPAFYAFGLFGLYAYTGPPFRLKAHALGEAAMVVWFGTAPVAAVAYVQVERFPPLLMVMSVPIGFLTAAILVGNNLRDARGDAAAGVRTLAHVAGERATRWVYVFFVIGAPAGISAVGVAAGVPLLALTLLALLPMAGPIRSVLKGRRLPDIDARTARLPVGVGLIATAVLLWSGGL
ncbi:MAG: prenyltransferase [Planctomycetota bacterium]